MGKLYERAMEFHNCWNEYQGQTIKERKISVVIPTYHPSCLKEVLEHLSKLNQVYEVVVVFDSYDDDPNSVIGDYNFHLNIVRHDKNRNGGAADNTGAVHANGDIILFINQDMILSPSFIPNAYKLFSANGDRGLVLGFRDTVKYENVPSLENWREADYSRDWRVKTPVKDSYLDLTISSCGSVSNNCDKDSILEIYKSSNQDRKSTRLNSSH